MSPSARCNSPPPPMPSPVLLPVSLPSPPVRRKHILPRPATPPAISLYERSTSSPVRERARAISAGTLSTSSSPTQHARLEVRESVRQRSVPSPNRRLRHHGRSGSPPPTSRRRSASPPPPVPAIPTDVRTHYRLAVPVSAPVGKTQFFPALPSPSFLHNVETKTKQRIAHIVPTRREVGGVSYWDFTLPTHALSPPRVLPELEADDGNDSSDEDSRAGTPTPPAPVGPPRSRGCRTVGTALEPSGAVTIAQFLGMAEPRPFTAAGH
jgi:hypothetical protein